MAEQHALAHDRERLHINFFFVFLRFSSLILNCNSKKNCPAIYFSPACKYRYLNSDEMLMMQWSVSFCSYSFHLFTTLRMSNLNANYIRGAKSQSNLFLNLISLSLGFLRWISSQLEISSC